MTKISSEAFFLVKKGESKSAFERRPFEIKAPEANEVLVEVEAFGLNYADVMARRGLYREAPPFPCVVGYEAVGKVVQCGPDADQSLLNKRVIAFCRFGGYARHVITNDYAVVPVQDQPAEELLALCTQAVTAYYMAEYLTPIHKIDTVLIHAAAGGVGTMLIQLAKLKGATVIAKIGREEKTETVKKLGADYVVNYNSSDYAEQINTMLNGKRIDISFNPAAGSTYKKDMQLLGSGGRIILFGASEMARGKWGFFSKLNFVRKMGFVLPIGLMMRSKNIMGVNMLKIADNKPKVMEHCLNKVVELYSSGKIAPQVGGKYSADQLCDAHDALESGKTTGKLSVFWDNPTAE
ncbi:MAG: zinc-binding dehydrogenase [Crocinitomicaceae bacterium]|nr:zinc-binding dehydrogenase [Crocinitomicaceae bacterium]